MSAHEAARVIGPEVFELAESPVWLPATSTLAFVDILKGDLHLWDFAYGENAEDQQIATRRTLHLDTSLGAIAPAQDGGGFVAAVTDGFAYIPPDALRNPQAARAPENRGVPSDMSMLAPILADLPDQRMNDGKCDPQGAFVAGTTSWTNREGESALYRLETNGRVTILKTGLSNSNGLCWSADGSTMFHIDTPTRQISVWRYRVGAPLGDPERLISLSEWDGVPDGMTIDADGNLWVAFWGGGCVRAISPTGALLAEVRLPASQPTSCVFGGPDGGTLYITSARLGIEDSPIGKAESADGAIFACRPGVVGSPGDSWLQGSLDASGERESTSQALLDSDQLGSHRDCPSPSQRNS